MTTGTESIQRLTADLRSASTELGRSEARFLVDSYYSMQDQRKALSNELRALYKSDEPHDTVAFFSAQFELLENEIKKALDAYSDSDQLGRWARSQYGVGPVITAGLLAHIDISRARTAGAIWRYAGLDPSSKWEKGQKRPWNAHLKVLCWKLGDSFKKFHNQDECFYGKLYEQRKTFEVERDEAGGNAATAKNTLEERNIRDKATKETYEAGHLPAGRLDLRAMRWAVKIFLAHYQEVGWTIATGTPPPDPYPISHLGHAHRIMPPNWPQPSSQSAP
jgi:hypothetical protein